MPHLLRGTFAAATLTLLAGPLLAQAKGLAVGDQAPGQVVIHTLTGQPAPLDNIIGKTPALIEFWATWCPLCREMEPMIQQIHATHGDRLALVRIVVPQNQTPERAREYVARHALPGTFLFDTDGVAYKAFAAYHTSYIVLLDRTGRVTYSSDGGKQDLAAGIAAALRE